MGNIQTRYQAAEGFVHRKVAGNDVLIAVGRNVANFNGYITLNPTASFLWDKLTQPQSVRSLADLLSEEFDVTPEEARNGSDLILNLDAAIQNRAQKLLAGMQGAIAVMDASDGAVLALASAPDYNLNSFIPGIPFNEYRELLRHPGKPFVNKALQGSYMPGSILKILLGLSLLENGVADVESKVHCDGFTAFSRSFRIRCWAHASGGHGPLALTDALKVSCNDYFIENGVKLCV